MGCRGKPATRPVEIEVVNGVKRYYWACPSKFIPPNIINWYRTFWYVSKFSTVMPPLKEVSYRYIQACMMYDSYKTEFLKAMKNSKKGKGK